MYINTVQRHVPGSVAGQEMQLQRMRDMSARPLENTLHYGFKRRFEGPGTKGVTTALSSDGAISPKTRCQVGACHQSPWLRVLLEGPFDTGSTYRNQVIKTTPSG